jgi:hypothetical protein
VFHTKSNIHATTIALIILFLIGIALVYIETKKAYRSVGFNDGQIYQQEQIIKRIQKLVAIQECRKHQTALAPIEFVSVKADSIYIITIDGKTVQFCR